MRTEAVLAPVVFYAEQVFLVLGGEVVALLLMGPRFPHAIVQLVEDPVHAVFGEEGGTAIEGRKVAYDQLVLLHTEGEVLTQGFQQVGSPVYTTEGGGVPVELSDEPRALHAYPGIGCPVPLPHSLDPIAHFPELVHWPYLSLKQRSLASPHPPKRTLFITSDFDTHRIPRGEGVCHDRPRLILSFVRPQIRRSSERGTFSPSARDNRKLDGVNGCEKRPVVGM